MRGALSDANDPARVGLIRSETLGSLLRGADGARWASLMSNARLGGDAALISSLVDVRGRKLRHLVPQDIYKPRFRGFFYFY